MALIYSIRNQFSNINFETFEAEHNEDLCADIDYLGWVGKKAFGIQIKPVTAKANFGNYSASERMKVSFDSFTKIFGGKVFVVFSIDDRIANKEVSKAITAEIKRFSK